jgi:hypothetical protein
VVVEQVEVLVVVEAPVRLALPTWVVEVAVILEVVALVLEVLEL